jgi:inner membrane protein
MPSTDEHGRPSATIWFVAVLSIVLPIIGVGGALYGLFQLANGAAGGWAWLAAGILLLVVDLIVDRRWAGWATSSEPDLNRRGDQLVGQVVTVVEPIERGGRGSVRAADSVWPAEGAEAARGARVRVAGCKGTVLTVEAA